MLEEKRPSENSFSDDLGCLKLVFCFDDKAPKYPLLNIEYREILI